MEKDPKQVKRVFQDCWAISDSKEAFSHALKEQGYFLAQGRRGHVAIDFKGEKYPISRYVGIQAKDVRAKLGEADGLPSIEQAQQQATKQISTRIYELFQEQQKEIEAKRQQAAQQQTALQVKQADETALQKTMQNNRQEVEEEKRQSGLHGGLIGFWDRFTGRRKATELQNQFEAAETRERDQEQTQKPKDQQQQKFEALKKQAPQALKVNEEAVKELKQDIRDCALPASQEAPKHDTPQQSSYAEEQRAKARQARQNHARDKPTLER